MPTSAGGGWPGALLASFRSRDTVSPIEDMASGALYSVALSSSTLPAHNMGSFRIVDTSFSLRWETFLSQNLCASNKKWNIPLYKFLCIIHPNIEKSHSLVIPDTPYFYFQDSGGR